MEEFESYFESLHFHFTNWNDILESENIDIFDNRSCENAEQNVQLLPRKDVSLFGIIPKMERRSFSSCKECKHIFNPRDVLLHRNCSFKVKTQHIPHFRKKVKTKKKPPLIQTGLESISPLEQLNTTELRQNSMYIANADELQRTDASANPTLAKPSRLPEDVGDIPLPPIHNSSSRNHTYNIDNKQSSTTVIANSNDNINKSMVHSSSKSKKKKKYSKELEVAQCATSLEDAKGPCTRSIKYSNHNSVNEYFHEESKSLSVDDISQTNSQEIPVSVPVDYLPISESTLVCSQTSERMNEEVKSLNAEETGFPRPTSWETLSVSNENDTFSQIYELFNHEGKSLSQDDGYFSQNYSQEMQLVTMPVGYGVLSPISTSVPLDIFEEDQFKGSSLDILSEVQISRELRIKIPDQLNVKMYKSRPRLTTSTFHGTERRTLMNQRKDILDTINAAHHNDVNNSSCYRSLSFSNNSNKQLMNSVNENNFSVRKISLDNYCTTNNDLKNVHSSNEMNGFIDLTDENNEQQENVDETYSYLNNNNNNDRKQHPPNNSQSCVLS